MKVLGTVSIWKRRHYCFNLQEKWVHKMLHRQSPPHHSDSPVYTCIGCWPWCIHFFLALSFERLSWLASRNRAFFGFLFHLRHIMGLCAHAKVLSLLTTSMQTQDDVMQCILSLPTNFTYLFWHLHPFLTTIITSNYGIFRTTTSRSPHLHQSSTV